MYRLLFLIAIALTNQLLSAQFISRMELREPIEGVCDQDNVYILFTNSRGQFEARPSVSISGIASRLKSKVGFLKTQPKYKGEAAVNLIINCNGELVYSKMEVKTDYVELDNQILQVFNSIKKWKPGKIDSKHVDSSIIFSFKIKKGEFIFE